MNDQPTYVLERQFAAPRELVWRAWTDPELLHRWYGPGAETTIHKFELEPGGVWLNEMRWGGNSHYQKVVFQKVDAPASLEWLHHSCTNAEWEDVTNPMMADWPRLLLTTVTFTEQDGQTQVRLTQTPRDATDAEVACFAAAMANQDKGWGSGYAIIDKILAELQNG